MLFDFYQIPDFAFTINANCYFYRNDVKKDLLENDTVWTNSYYLAWYGGTRLIPCITLDVPEKNLIKPKKSWVSFNSIYCIN